MRYADRAAATAQQLWQFLDTWGGLFLHASDILDGLSGLQAVAIGPAICLRPGSDPGQRIDLRRPPGRCSETAD
jgi:hypothetical protein